TCGAWMHAHSTHGRAGTMTRPHPDPGLGSGPGPGSPRVVLGLPVADASASEAAERAGLTVVATAATAGLLKRQVAAVRPDVVLLHAALPHADPELVAAFARAGLPTLLLVDAGLRRGDDLIAGPPYPPYVLAQQERLG